VWIGRVPRVDARVHVRVRECVSVSASVSVSDDQPRDHPG